MSRKIMNWKRRWKIATSPFNHRGIFDNTCFFFHFEYPFTYIISKKCHLLLEYFLQMNLRQNTALNTYIESNFQKKINLLSTRKQSLFFVNVQRRQISIMRYFRTSHFRVIWQYRLSRHITIQHTHSVYAYVLYIYDTYTYIQTNRICNLFMRRFSEKFPWVVGKQAKVPSLCEQKLPGVGTSKHYLHTMAWKFFHSINYWLLILLLHIICTCVCVIWI